MSSYLSSPCSAADRHTSQTSRLEEMHSSAIPEGNNGQARNADPAGKGVPEKRNANPDGKGGLAKRAGNASRARASAGVSADTSAIGGSRPEPVAGSAEQVKLDQQPEKLELTHEEQDVRWPSFCCFRWLSFAPAALLRSPSCLPLVRVCIFARPDPVRHMSVVPRQTLPARALRERVEAMYQSACQAQQKHDAACRQLGLFRKVVDKHMPRLRLAAAASVSISGKATSLSW